MAPIAYFLGVDQGTQSTKAVLFDERGTEVSFSSLPVKMNYSNRGLITQSPDEIFRSVVKSIRNVVVNSGISPNNIVALTIDSQICSMVTIDKKWQPVTPIISHLDVSTNQIRDQILDELGDRIISQNGSLPYIAARLLWIKQTQPDLFRQIFRVMLVGAYCSGKLCDLSAEEAYVDQTTMNVFGWGDLLRGSWDQDLAEKMNIDPELSPKVRSSIEIIGGLSKSAADMCGLCPGTPVLAGIGDAIAGWMGVGADRPGLVVDTSGSANHLCFCVDEFKPDITKRILSYYPSISESLGYQIGFTAGTGKSHRWFVDLLQAGNITDAKRDRSERINFHALDNAAQEVPPLSEGVIFIPHFGGRICPLQPELRGGWLGIRWEHNEAHLYRAILESITYEYDLYIHRAQELYPDLHIDSYYVVGGGSKSAIWAQIKADVLGIPVRVLPGANNLAARGSAMLAAKATGSGEFFLPSRLLHKAEEFTPNEENHELYHRFSRKYQRILEYLQKVYLE